jgi:hypothetical protein
LINASRSIRKNSAGLDPDSCEFGYRARRTPRRQSRFGV